jgi:hypothetical protein
MTQDEIIASNLSEIEKANERIKMLEDKLASIKQAIADLESQEPLSTLWQHGETGRFRITPPDSITDCDARWFKVGDLYPHPPQRTEQNFCPRCGKRTKDLTHIHTCTPPHD